MRRGFAARSGVGGEREHGHPGATRWIGGGDHRLHYRRFHGICAGARRPSGPAHRLRFHGQPIDRLGASTRDPGFLHDMSNYFARLNVNGEARGDRQRYYGRSEDLEFVGARGLHAAFASGLPLYKKWFEEAAEQSSQD